MGDLKRFCPQLYEGRPCVAVLVPLDVHHYRCPRCGALIMVWNDNEDDGEVVAW